MAKDFYGITEIFTSIQGEARYTGVPMVFVRFSGCNLRCPWCDTQYEKMQNYPFEKLVNRIVDEGKKAMVDWVSFTGGEPALWIDDDILSAVKSEGFKLLLETNATNVLTENLFEYVDTVSADFKLAYFGFDEALSLHSEFLKQVSKLGVDFYVKLLFSFSDSLEDVAKALEYLFSLNCEVYLQPLYEEREKFVKRWELFWKKVRELVSGTEIDDKAWARVKFSFQIHKFLRLK